MNTWEALKLVFSKKKRQAITEAPARDPKKMAIKKIGQAIKDGGSEFEESVVDLQEIERAYFTDSYIRRAVDKYSELMFKEGWDIPGRNEKATNYVWTRLKLMAEATGQPIQEMMKEIAHDLVLFGNAFVVKARQKGSYKAPGINAQGYSGKQPVAGYFVLPPTTIQISRDENGRVLQYQQSTGGGQPIVIKPEDMIHFHYKRPRGRAFGVPFIFNVLDDVKILRQIEENVARLIYRNLFPLYQYQVGLDKPGYEATEEEIEYIREQIREMPMDGGIVVPERHNITVIGAEGNAIDASEYLKYFRQRVFTGLGVSDSVMGIGDTANKSTSDNQSADLIDGVKEFQSIFATTFTDKIVNELLFEGGFDPILKPEDEVIFQFSEIALDAKIKKENHAVQLFTQNAITHEEMRQIIGLDPVSDESRLYFNMITASLNAQAAEQKIQAANNAGDNKNRPANQHGKKDNPGKPKRNREVYESLHEWGILQENSTNVLTAPSVKVNLYSELDISRLIHSSKSLWNSLREDIIEMMRLGKTSEFIQQFAIEPFKQSIISTFSPYIEQLIQEGISQARKEIGKEVLVDQPHIRLAAKDISSLVASYVQRLLEDIQIVMKKAWKEESMGHRASMITGVFESNEYRLAFIARTELHRAFNYGKVLVAQAAQIEKVIPVVNTENPNHRCKERAGKPISINQPKADILKLIPAYHPNCQCTVTLTTPTEEVQ